MTLHHILTSSQFHNQKTIERIFSLADLMEKTQLNGAMTYPLSGKILASLFYEPSTRTRFSFEAAITKLGGNVISTENASQFSSVTKGETLEDTIQILNGYADVIVLRHWEKGSAKRAAKVSHIPVINAGDGSGEHPTQALLDIYTIYRRFRKLAGLRIALVGDLLYGRTIHSLISFLNMYKPKKVFLVSPKKLRLPKDYMDFLRKNKILFKETQNLESVLPQIDVLYMTRVQKERFSSPEKYAKVKNAYVITAKMLKKLNKDAIIMHPLPRITEIEVNVDSDPRAIYFQQAKNGLYIRMALLFLLLSGNGRSII